MSRRTEQMASTLLRALQEIITRGLQDPRVSGLITVTGLRVSEDKREATVMVSVLPADRQELTMHGLRAAVPHIRHQLGEMVDMRNTPNLSFKLDGSLKKQAGVIAALSKVSEERERAGVDGTAPFGDAMVSREPADEESAADGMFDDRGGEDRPGSRSDAGQPSPRTSTRKQRATKNTGTKSPLGAGPSPQKSGIKPSMKFGVKSGTKPGANRPAKSKSESKKPDRPNSKQGEPRR